MNVRPDLFLVVGADGQIGRALSMRLREIGVDVVETTHRPASISNSRFLVDLAADQNTFAIPVLPTVAFLGAGVTTLSACRADPVTSTQINVRGTVALARWLIERGCFVVFPSTNLVFDGSAPFRRTHDATSPKTEYGRQKVEAEKHILALGGAAVLRFTKVLTEGGILTQWAHEIMRRETIRPFENVRLAPIMPSHAVEAILRLAKYRLPGIFHAGPSADITYEEAAQRIAWRLGQVSRVRPVPYLGSELEAPPQFTTLCTSRTERELGLATPSVWDTIDWVTDCAVPQAPSEAGRVAQ